MLTFRVGGWCKVMVKSFNEHGEPGPDVMLTAFGGSDGGRSEAGRLAAMLNDAVEAFYRADAPPLAAGVNCNCPSSFCPMHGKGHERVS